LERKSRKNNGEIMKLNNKQIIDCLAGLNSLSKEKMPIGLSYKIDIIRQNLEPYFLAANHMISEIKTEYAKKDESNQILLQKNIQGEPIPGAFLFSQENLAIVNQEINEVLADSTEFPELHLKISEFPPSLMISPDVLVNLRGLILNQ